MKTKTQVFTGKEIVKKFGNLSQSLKNNPRIGNINAAAGKSMQQTIEEMPEYFLPCNQGIDIINGKYVVNGGTTLQILLKNKNHPHLSQVKVIVKEHTNISKEMIPLISAGLNGGVKVKKTDTANLKGNFNLLKKVLKDTNFEDRVVFKTGCFGIRNKKGRPVDGVKVLILLRMLNTISSHANTYKSSESYFVKQLEEGVYDTIVDLVPTLLKIHDACKVACIKAQERFTLAILLAACAGIQMGLSNTQAVKSVNTNFVKEIVNGYKRSKYADWNKFTASGDNLKVATRYLNKKHKLKLVA